MFLIGCNYWASDSGCEMWISFNPNTVEADFRLLAEYGIKFVRVFPVWRDFQPIKTIKTYQGQVRETVFENGEGLTNIYGLDLSKTDNFIRMCEIAEKYGLRLIVSIVTGWMSGVLLTPQAVQNMNLLTDPYALKWERLYVNGFVKHTKNCKAIYAWEIGNECECMGEVINEAQAYVWMSLITDAIRAADCERPILSGLSDNGIAGKWNLKNQAELTDMVTPHLYYTDSNGGTTDRADGMKTTYLGAALCDVYAGVSGKPALLEEIGTLNEIYMSQKTAADCLRVNLLECWAKGSSGFLWWCAFDQKNLDFSPYDYSMRELGLFKNDMNPKSAANELKALSDFIYGNGLERLERPKTRVVCVLPFLSDFWKAASAVAVLGYQNSIDIDFKTVRQEIPAADVYIVPCIGGWSTMPKKTYRFLTEQVYKNGAKLYVSAYDGVLENITEVFGIENKYAAGENAEENISFNINGESVTLKCFFKRKMHPKIISAKALAYDNAGNAVLIENRYGKGKTYFLTFPLENMLWGRSCIFKENYYKIYSLLFSELLNLKTVKTADFRICVTEHMLSDDKILVIAVNHTELPRNPEFEIKSGYKCSLLYGDFNTIPKCDAAVMLLEKNKETTNDI